MTKKVHGHCVGRAVMSRGRGEWAGAVNGDERRQLTLFGSHVSRVDVNVPDRGRLALVLG